MLYVNDKGGKEPVHRRMCSASSRTEVLCDTRKMHSTVKITRKFKELKNISNQDQNTKCPKPKMLNAFKKYIYISFLKKTLTM